MLVGNTNTDPAFFIVRSVSPTYCYVSTYLKLVSLLRHSKRIITAERDPEYQMEPCIYGRLGWPWILVMT